MADYLASLFFAGYFGLQAWTAWRRGYVTTYFGVFGQVERPVRYWFLFALNLAISLGCGAYFAQKFA